MVSWKNSLEPLEAERYTRADEPQADLLTARARLEMALGGPAPVKVLTCLGYGTPEGLSIHGRVIEERKPDRRDKNGKKYRTDDLLSRYRRAGSSEVPHAILSARFQEREQVVTADEEGFFEFTLQPTRPLVERRLWHAVELQLLQPIPIEQTHHPVTTVAQVLVPPPGARFAIVSAVDGLLWPQAPDLREMAHSIFQCQPSPALPFAGAAALFHALFAGAGRNEMNPLFYLSTLPCNLYELLAQHMALHGIPTGPLLLPRKELHAREELSAPHQRAHKLGTLNALLERYPRLPFLLIGDSAAGDSEIFSEIMAQHPGRVQAAFVHRAGESNLVEQAAPNTCSGSGFTLFENAAAVVRSVLRGDWFSSAGNET